MRELFQAVSLLENQLQARYGLSLNEAMVLCSVGHDCVSAGTIAECTGLSPSHTSKVIGSTEKKGLLSRQLNEKDKRLMCFTLTDKAHLCLQQIKEQGLEIPEKLQAYFE